MISIFHVSNDHEAVVGWSFGDWCINMHESDMLYTVLYTQLRWQSLLANSTGVFSVGSEALDQTGGHHRCHYELL